MIWRWCKQPLCGFSATFYEGSLVFCAYDLPGQWRLRGVLEMFLYVYT